MPITTKFRGLKIAGKDAEHLKSMLRTMVTQLIEHQRIETTLPKAKLVKRFADKMVTLGKRGRERDFVQAFRFVRSKVMVEKLFGEMAERYKDRQGGYTRVLRTRNRKGDGAQMAFIEYVDRPGEIRPARPPPARLAAEEAAAKVEAVENPVDIDGGVVAEPLEGEAVMDAAEEAAVAGEPEQTSQGQSKDA